MHKHAKNSATATVCLAIASIVKMTQAARITAFADRVRTSARTFIELGKLRFEIERNLKPNQTIYGVFRAEGVRDSAISNAGYGAKVFELVVKKVLTEQEFDGMTFGDCFTICRVMGGKSARRLSAEDVAVVIREGGKDWDKQLESIYETGHTIEEREVMDRETADAAKVAAKKTETKRVNKKAAKKAAQIVAKQAAKSAKSAATPVAAGKVTPMPTQPATEKEIFGLLDEVLTETAKWDTAAQKRLAVKLSACAGKVNERMKPATKAKAA